MSFTETSCALPIEKLSVRKFSMGFLRIFGAQPTLRILTHIPLQRTVNSLLVNIMSALALQVRNFCAEHLYYVFL